MRPSLDASEYFEIPIPAHTRRAQKVLDDENRNFMIGRNDKRARNTGLGVNQVVSSLSIEDETFPLKDCDQR
jgi:hypothetical protein